MCITKTKQEIMAYLLKLKNDKSELMKIAFLAILSIYLTMKFSGSFGSTLGYDVRAEFSGYLILVSFISFLFISNKSEKKTLKLLSFFHTLICLTNFLIIKSFSTIFLLKIITVFLSIFLLLVILREVKNCAN